MAMMSPIFKRTGSVSRGNPAPEHNDRSAYFDENGKQIKDAPNIDFSQSYRNVTLVNRDLSEAYEETFGEAVAEYNKKQVEKKHPERQITDYLQKIKDDKRGQKPVYEFVVGVGGVDDDGVRHDLDSDERYTNIYTEWIEQFKKKYGKQFEIVQAIIHFDEPNGTPHMHVEVVPVAESKRGVSVQNSLNKAIEQCGAANDNKFNDFVSMMDDWRDVTLADAMLKYGVEKVAGKGEKHGHIESGLYTKQKQTERELDGQIEKKRKQLEEISEVLEQFSSVTQERLSINTELEDRNEALSQENREAQEVLDSLTTHKVKVTNEVKAIEAKRDEKQEEYETLADDTSVLFDALALSKKYIDGNSDVEQSYEQKIKFMDTAIENAEAAKESYENSLGVFDFMRTNPPIGERLIDKLFDYCEEFDAINPKFKITQKLKAFCESLGIEPFGQYADDALSPPGEYGKDPEAWNSILEPWEQRVVKWRDAKLGLPTKRQQQRMTQEEAAMTKAKSFRAAAKSDKQAKKPDHKAVNDSLQEATRRLNRQQQSSNHGGSFGGQMGFGSGLGHGGMGL